MSQKKQPTKTNKDSDIPFVMKPYYEYPYKQFTLLRYEGIKYTTGAGSELIDIGKDYDRKYKI